MKYAQLLFYFNAGIVALPGNKTIPNTSAQLKGAY
jgi:hypothetical protein